MGAHGDGVQTAVVLVLAVVGAVGDRALDALVGGAGAAVVGIRQNKRSSCVKKCVAFAAL